MRQSSGLPTVKPRPSISFGSIYFAFFPAPGVTPKNRPDFHQNGRRGFIYEKRIMALYARLRAYTCNSPVKTVCRYILTHFCYELFQKIGFGQKILSFSSDVP